jgi:hypothetical protein
MDSNDAQVGVRVGRAAHLVGFPPPAAAAGPGAP